MRLGGNSSFVSSMLVTALGFTSSRPAPALTSSKAKGISNQPITRACAGDASSAVRAPQDIDLLDVNFTLDKIDPTGFGIKSSFQVIRTGRDPSQNPMIVKTVSRLHADMTKTMLQTPGYGTEERRTNPPSQSVPSREDLRTASETPVKTPTSIQEDELRGGLSAHVSKDSTINFDVRFHRALQTCKKAHIRIQNSHRCTQSFADHVLALNYPTRYLRGHLSCEAERAKMLASERDLAKKHGVSFDASTESLRIADSYIRTAGLINENVKVLHDESRDYRREALEAYSSALELITREAQLSHQPPWKDQISLQKYTEAKMPGFESVAAFQKQLDEAVEEYESLRQDIANKARIYYEQTYGATGLDRSWLKILDETLDKLQKEENKEKSREIGEKRIGKDQVELLLAEKYGPQNQDFKNEIKNLKLGKQRLNQAYKQLYQEQKNNMGKPDSEYSQFLDEAIDRKEAARRAEEIVYEEVLYRIIAKQPDQSKASLEALHEHRMRVLHIAWEKKQQGTPISPLEAVTFEQQEFVNKQAEKCPDIKDLQFMADRLQNQYLYFITRATEMFETTA